MVHIGVRAYQFPLVGEILLNSFERVLGEQFDNPTKTAWIKLISGIMMIMIPAVLREEALLTPEQREAHETKIREHQALGSTTAVEEQTFRKLKDINASVHSGGGPEGTVRVVPSVETIQEHGSSKTIGLAEDDSTLPSATLPSAGPVPSLNLNGGGGGGGLVTAANAPDAETTALVSARVSKSMKEAVIDVQA